MCTCHAVVLLACVLPVAEGSPGPGGSTGPLVAPTERPRLLDALIKRHVPRELALRSLPLGSNPKDTAMLFPGSAMDAFASLQKVDRVLKRIREQTPRPRPSLTGEDGQPFGR